MLARGRGCLAIAEYKRYANPGSDPGVGIKSPTNETTDETYVLPIFESTMRHDLSAIHPAQFIFGTDEPGLSASVGPLAQNWVCLQGYLDEDPNQFVFEEA